MAIPDTGLQGRVAAPGAETVLGSGVQRPSLGSLASLTIPPEVLRALPADFVKRHLVLPLRIYNGTIEIGTSQTANHRVIDDIRLLTGLEVQEVLLPATEIVEKVAECYQVTVEKMIESLNPAPETAVEGRNLHDIEVMANEPTVINLVNLIISTALRERASDIHLVPYEGSIQLRYRIDGLLQEKPPPPKHLHPALVSRVKIMADMNIAERYMPQDGHIQINHRGGRVDIRVGTLPTIYGEAVVLRLLEKDSKVLTTEELGLDAERAALLMRLVEKPHGLFLATGPTGSGKTTTLYSVLRSIYTPEKKIVTIEDPVEYELPGVAQIPVRPNRNFTFANGLRSILRQDPDIIMVGEIRDSETAEIAIRAALTGHQVFSTLHTNDSTGAITRLLDMGVEAFLISSSLEGVLAQRLLRRICPDCKTVWPVSFKVLERLEMLGGSRNAITLRAGSAGIRGDSKTDGGDSHSGKTHIISEDVRSKTGVPEGAFYHGTGCEECRGTGYRGRVGIFELLAIDNELREMILQKRSNAELKTAARRTMLTMHLDALQKAVAGITSLEEVVRVSSGDMLE